MLDSALFGILSVICAGLVYVNYTQRQQQQRSADAAILPANAAAFSKFQWNYLVPYLVMSMSDWLQGPYVYALYKKYGFEIGQIGLLFIVGFGSSMVFGTIVGGFSDKYGRKLSCMLFAVLYILSCLTKHSPSFYVLLVGRVLGGIATSILFSAFESWMVSEHFKSSFSEDSLGNTFYKQVFGNGLIAILSGLLASFVTSKFDSMVAPFDTAIVFLAIGGVYIYFNWSENYGDASADWKQNFIDGWNALRNDRKIALLGMSQGCFESSMYIFVFMWTPTLDIVFGEGTYSHGMIFACYMVATMVGSNIFNLFSARMELENLLLYVFVGALASMFAPVIISSGSLVLLSFLLFEVSVGMFWPCISTLKGIYIPESVRATVMNYFRIPTNMFVLLVLNNVKQLHYKSVFTICCVLLVLSIACQMLIVRIAGNSLLFFEKKAGKPVLKINDELHAIERQADAVETRQ